MSGRRGLTAGLSPKFWDGRFVVYRYWDANNRLLYIGSTRNVAQRDTSHANGGSGAWWYPLVARMRIELHPTREAVTEAERLAVEEETPAFNIRWTGRPFLDQSTWTAEDRRLEKLWHRRENNRIGWWLMRPRLTAR